MASQNDNGFRTFLASGAISSYKAVDVQSDGTISGCAFGVKGVGVLQEDAADGNYAQVKLWSAPGTFMLQATGTAITAGTDYSIGTGGFVTPVDTGATAKITALAGGVASNGIIVEYAQY